MRMRCVGTIRNHLHVLLIVPLVVIVMTWPTFARIFDSDDYWFHTEHGDIWFRIWDAWHIERVLAGQERWFYSDEMFHPTGASLAWQHFSYPHAAMLIVLRKLMPVDSAYNLLFLLTLSFNSICGYILILHLIGHKWIALFGAIVFGLSIPFPSGSTTPDLIMIGTIPLTIYFFHRHVREKRLMLAALAGICAGVTAYVGVYAFVIILISVGVITIFEIPSHWRQPTFRRGLLVFSVVCSSICAFRFYPMFVDAAVLKEGLEIHLHNARSNDVLECCVFTGNPLTADLFHKLITFLQNQETATWRHDYNIGYIGYINLFLALCALLHKPLRRKLAPWLALLAVFAILRLGDFLTLNGQEYRAVLLPEHFLSKWFPAFFGNVAKPKYYQFGVVAPLAVLASFGLARLTKSKTNLARAAAVLVSIVIVALEFYAPPAAMTVETEKMAYNDWLSTEPDSAIKLINLPQGTWSNLYFLGQQTFNNYPMAFGSLHRSPVSARSYVYSNRLLQAWDENRSVHCLPHNERSFLTALDSLLADGFSHIVVHDWFLGDRFINYSFRNQLPSYDDGLVRVYRLRDLRLSCESIRIEHSPFMRFADSPAVFPGRRSSILSLHPSKAIDKDLFAYLASLFSDWRSLIHLHLDGGEPVLQNAGESIRDLASFARDNQVIYLIYDRHDVGPAALRSHLSLDEFNLCRREEHKDGSVLEHYLSRQFSCALVDSGQALQVDYDNGAKLVSAWPEISRDQLALQAMWSRLPSESHALSLQVFNADGDKVHGQDSIIGDASLGHYRVDLADLPPGDYALKLIVYNYETRRSVPGTFSRTGERIERELFIKTFTRT